ncbi:MAG: amidase [Streptosporangiales bacterium]|nr:amidase [Streptosporangiales bacterium]MBO0892653.1 amidase [Acidothermales bacterium]
MRANELTVVDALARISAGELTPAELVDGCLERIALREPEVGAWELVDGDAARREAGRDPQGSLRGVPVAVKDIVDVAGLPTRCGTPLRGDHVAAADAWCVRRLRAAGAVVLGKTVTTEFAYFHPGKTRNPHALDHTPGGSSSGSAAAVADMMVPCAIGSQTAGSTVRPASYCGVVGFVPGEGRLALDGVQHLAPSLDRLGLFARTVEDVRVLYTAIADDAAAPRPGPPPRVLVSDGTAVADVHPAMRYAVRHAADRIADLGVPVEPFDAADLERDWSRAQSVVMAYDAARTLADVAAAHRDQLSERLVELLDTGAATPDETYRAALAAAADGRRTLDDRLDGGAVLLAPAATGPAPRDLTATGDPAMSRPWHLLGGPEIALPAAETEGLPVGVQLVGAYGADDALLDAAAWLAGCLSQ